MAKFDIEPNKDKYKVGKGQSYQVDMYTYHPAVSWRKAETTSVEPPAIIKNARIDIDPGLTINSDFTTSFTGWTLRNDKRTDLTNDVVLRCQLVDLKRENAINRANTANGLSYAGETAFHLKPITTVEERAAVDNRSWASLAALTKSTDRLAIIDNAPKITANTQARIGSAGAVEPLSGHYLKSDSEKIRTFVYDAQGKIAPLTKADSGRILAQVYQDSYHRWDRNGNTTVATLGEGKAYFKKPEKVVLALHEDGFKLRFDNSLAKQVRAGLNNLNQDVNAIKERYGKFADVNNNADAIKSVQDAITRFDKSVDINKYVDVSGERLTVTGVETRFADGSATLKPTTADARSAFSKAAVRPPIYLNEESTPFGYLKDEKIKVNDFGARLALQSNLSRDNPMYLTSMIANLSPEEQAKVGQTVFNVAEGTKTTRVPGIGVGTDDVTTTVINASRYFSGNRIGIVGAGDAYKAISGTYEEIITSGLSPNFGWGASFTAKEDINNKT